MSKAVPQTKTANTKTKAVSMNRKSVFAVSRCFVALVFVFTTYWLLNYCAFPLFDGISLWTREISAAAGGLALIAIALVALWRPTMLRRFFLMKILVILGGGTIAMLIGLYFAAFAPLIVGASLVTIGVSLASVVVGLACMNLSIRLVGICIACSYMLAYTLRILFSSLTVEVNFSLFIVIPFVTLALCEPLARPVLRKILAAEPPAQTAITSPGSFLPFAHQVFITLVIFRFIYGYTLTFGETERVPLSPLFTLVPFVLYVLYSLIKKNSLNPDMLFRFSILLSVAGFLIPSITGTNNDLIASNLLNGGTGFFEILMYFVLVALATKNNTNALVVLTWGTAMASLGTIIGANFGRLANQYYHVDTENSAIISACIVFGLVVYILATQGNFSFTGTISKVEEVSPLHSSKRSPDFDLHCAKIAEIAGLTTREKEIFILLSQGRNARFIQEKLVVSYNTVKTHVSHIYGKLNIHNHQELIDLVNPPT